METLVAGPDRINFPHDARSASLSQDVSRPAGIQAKTWALRGGRDAKCRSHGRFAFHSTKLSR